MARNPTRKNLAADMRTLTAIACLLLLFGCMSRPGDETSKVVRSGFAS